MEQPVMHTVDEVIEGAWQSELRRNEVRIQYQEDPSMHLLIDSMARLPREYWLSAVASAMVAMVKSNQELRVELARILETHRPIVTNKE